VQLVNLEGHINTDAHLEPCVPAFAFTMPTDVVYLGDIRKRSRFYTGFERHRHTSVHWLVECFAEAVSSLIRHARQILTVEPLSVGSVFLVSYVILNHSYILTVFGRSTYAGKNILLYLDSGSN
jgi:uncharacterized membrane protein